MAQDGWSSTPHENRGQLSQDFAKNAAPPPAPEPPGSCYVYIRGFSVTNAKDPRPILGTTGAGPCVIVGLYNADQKIAGIAHLDAYTDINSLDRMIAKMGQGTLQAHLLGGSEQTRAFVEGIKAKLTGNPNINIVTDDTINPTAGLRQLAIDARTGETATEFMGAALEKSPYHQKTMAHHIATAMTPGPLRPEYVDGKDHDPAPTPAPVMGLAP